MPPIHLPKELLLAQNIKAFQRAALWPSGVGFLFA